MPDNEFESKTVNGMKIEALNYAKWIGEGSNQAEVLYTLWACTAEICHRLERIEQALRDPNPAPTEK